MTAAKSKIVNSLDENAIVKYLTEKEFINYINDYYKAVGLEGVSSLEEFANDNRIYELSEVGTKGKFLEDLKFLQKHLDDFKDKLGSEEDIIELDEIRRYISYEDENGNREHANWAAVKEVIINTKFPNEEVGKIAFVDLPGINEVKVGLLDKVAKELKENIDGVFIIKKPDTTGNNFDNNDVRLYDTLKDNLKEKTEEVTYLIINRTTGERGDNLKQCEILLEEVNSKSHIKVKMAKILNVTNENEVNYFMLEALDVLLKTLEKEDKNEQEQLKIKYDKLLEKINSISISEFKDSDKSKVIKEFIKEFKKNIKDIIKEFRNSTNKDEVVNNYKVLIVDQIEKKRKKLAEYENEFLSFIDEYIDKNYGVGITLFKFNIANEINTFFYEQIKQYVEKFLNEKKDLVRNALIKSGFVAKEDPLKEFVELLGKDKSLAKDLYELFKEFYQFEIDLKAMTVGIVYKIFDEFTDETKSNLYPKEAELAATQLIKGELDDTLIKLKKELLNNECFINLPYDSIKSEFLRVLEAFHLSEDMKENLSYLLMDNIEYLSSSKELNEKFKKSFEKKKIKEETVNLIKELKGELNG